MATQRDIKRRIRSVKNTQQITKAMKVVAASKLRRAQSAILHARPYALKMMEMMRHLAARCNPDTHPLLRERDERKILILVITADKGLCGGFNSNILRKTVSILKENSGKEVMLITAGKKGHIFFRTRSVEIARDYSGWTKKMDFLKAVEIGDVLMKLYLENAVDKIYVVYNEFKSVIQQEVVLEQLLPIVSQKLEGGERAVDYIYEPDELSILENLLKKYMNVEVYRAFLESAASENGARMTAMDNATRNASEMIDSLTLHYNKARQAYITKELIEVVNGAAAL